MTVRPPRTKKLISLLLSMGLIGILLFFSRSHLDKFSQLKDIDVIAFCLISLTFLASQVMLGLKLKVFARAFGIGLNFSEWFGLICLQSFLNYLPMSAGVLSNMAYLKKVKNLPVTKFVSYFAGDMLLKTLVFGIVGSAVLIFGIEGPLQKSLPLLIAFLLFVSVGLFFMFFPFRLRKSDHVVWGKVLQIQEGWNLVRKNPKLVVAGIAIHLIVLLTLSIKLHLIFEQLQIPTRFSSLVLLNCITNVFRMASLFPGNMGFREALSGATFSTLGLSFGLGVVGTTVDRLISALWIFVLGGFVTFIFWRRMRAQQGPDSLLAIHN